MATVSILSPSYQHSPFIADCIRSVLAQTVQDWQMIIVDDGSEDGTAEIAESFGDPRIIVVRRAHEGVEGLGRSYAQALERATGTFLAILECDDTWPPTKLESQVPLFDDPAVVLSYGSAGLMDESGCIYSRYWNAPRERIANNDPVGTIIPALVNVNFIVAATVMLRKSAVEQIGGFFQPPGVPYVDHPTWLRMATLGRFAHSPLVLGNWRRHDRQITTRSWFEAIPDRSIYLDAIANEARHILNASTFKELIHSSRRDGSRQREEAAVAEGRVALLNGEWRHATNLFRSLVHTGEVRTRMVAIAGLFCAATKMDMEWLISVAGRHSLPSRRHLASHVGYGVSGRKDREASE